MKRRREYEIYRGKDGRWWWREVAPNGRIVTTCAYGYVRQRAAIKAMHDHMEIIRSNRFFVTFTTTITTSR